MLLQTILTGLAIGGVYALMALGYSLVFSILNFSNFAHGTVIMLGAYCGYFLLKVLGAPFLVALLGAMGVAGVLAAVNERLAYRTLRIRKAPPLFFMISAMGVSLFLENAVYATIGSQFLAYPSVLPMSTVTIGDASIGALDLFALAFSLITIYGFHVFLQRSRLGLAIRAASYDMTVASVMGINLDKLVRTVFLLAGSMAGMSGIFLGMKYMAYPTMGWITNKAYIAAVIGGLGSLPGAVVGGIALGVLETFVSAYVSSTYRDAVSFSLLVGFLLVAPSGLMGQYIEEKI